jgi:hypothetical protein
MRSLILLVMVGCAHTVASPALQHSAPPVKPAPNLAVGIADAFVISPETKCMAWTGRGTPYGGVDSVLCVGPSQVIYIAAPNDGPPLVKIALELSSPAELPKKPDEKKPAKAKKK